MINRLVLIMVCAASLAAVSGCNTPQQKAYTPQPQSQPQLPPPPQAQQAPAADEADQQSAAPGEQMEAAAQAAAQQAADQASAAQAAAQQAADQASAAQQPAPRGDDGFPEDPAMQGQDTADVQITEVPLDENGNPIEPEPAPAAAGRSPDNSTATLAGNQPPRASQSASRPQGTAGAPGGRTKPGEGAQAAPTIGGTGNPDPSARGNVIAIGAQTDQEKLAAASTELDARLSSFDELMRRAREAAARQRAAVAAGGGAAGGQAGGMGANRSTEMAERGAGGQAETGSGLGHTPDVTGETSGGDYTHVATGPAPADIPDGRDDDIVARQLREAASRESDPVLREKLWEEYRKYKKGVVGR